MGDEDGVADKDTGYHEEDLVDRKEEVEQRVEVVSHMLQGAEEDLVEVAEHMQWLAVAKGEEAVVDSRPCVAGVAPEELEVSLSPNVKPLQQTRSQFQLGVGVCLKRIREDFS